MKTDSSRPISAKGFIVSGILMLLILVGGLGSWAALTQIAGAVIASGLVEVDQNQQVVQHPDGGVVKSILVDEGDLVKAGDLLVELDSSAIGSQLAVTETQLAEVMARRARLQAERDEAETVSFDASLLAMSADKPEIAELVDGQARLFDARRKADAREIEQLSKRAGQIQSQIGGLDAQLASMEEQLRLIEIERETQADLQARGLATAPRVLGLQREAARLQGSLGELIAGRAESEERITEIEISVLQLQNNRREEAITELRDLRLRELELAEERRALAERLSRLEIRAPVSGVVHALQVFTERAVIRPADPVMFIVPQDRPLVVSARVDPIHIDQIHLGQDAALRFSGLDARETPELKGVVVKRSADALTDQGTGIPYFAIEIELKPGEIDRLPGHIALIPGMPVESFLRTEDRTPLAYLVKPMADYFNKAFREN